MTSTGKLQLASKANPKTTIGDNTQWRILQSLELELELELIL